MWLLGIKLIHVSKRGPYKIYDAIQSYCRFSPTYSTDMEVSSFPHNSITDWTALEVVISKMLSEWWHFHFCVIINTTSFTPGGKILAQGLYCIWSVVRVCCTFVSAVVCAVLCYTGTLLFWDSTVYHWNRYVVIFWQNFHHWMHRKLSFWKLSVQPMMKISSNDNICVSALGCHLWGFGRKFTDYDDTQGADSI